MAKGPSKRMVTRMKILMVCLVFVFTGALLGQLASLQLVNSEEYQNKAIAQQLRTTTINPKRGTIYDSNMKVLAQSATVWTVALAPANIKDDAQLQTIAEGLSSILDVDQETIIEKGQNKKSYYEIVKRKVEKPQYDAITQFLTDNGIKAGVDMYEDSKRYYPYNDEASSVIGFTGTDNDGLYGLESMYDEYLQGVPGKVVSAKNAYNTDMPFEYETLIEPQDGNGLVLSIDERIQAILERHLEVAAKENNVTNRAAGIVMDVQTGEILAMATHSDFDLNSPMEIFDADVANEIASLTGDEQAEAKKQAQFDQWRNKPVSDTYEPGSVFKVITAAMALEEKKVSVDDTFNCPGYYVVGGRRISCARRTGHGTVTFKQGLEQSCNPTFMQVGERIGRNLFYQYFENFGFTEKTGIDLPGEATNAGLFHTEESLNSVELATSSFGQTFKVTPLQMITAISAVANGGYLLQPHVVRQILDSDDNIIQAIEPNVRRQVISTETSDLLRELMEGVVFEGGGKNAYLPGYRIAGKTGTSEKRDKVNEETGQKDLRIASFCGFAPADDPKVAVLIMLDEPHADNIFGGTIAAPVARDIFADVLPYLGVEPRYTAAELQQLDTDTPVLTGLSPADATAKAEQKGLKVRVVGSGDTVLKQMPSAGSTIPKSGTVVLYTNEDSEMEEVTVPNLVGLTVAQVNTEAANAGINVRFSGVGLESEDAVSTGQSVVAGEKVSAGTVIAVEFQHNVADDAPNTVADD